MNTALAGSSSINVFDPRASLPSVFTARPEARRRMRDFFSSHIRNPHTRRAYLEAVRQFSAFAAELGLGDLAQVEPIHVAAFVERQLETHAKPTVKQRLAALRMLFDWLVVGQVLAVNPAHAVRILKCARIGVKRLYSGRSDSISSRLHPARHYERDVHCNAADA